MNDNNTIFDFYSPATLSILDSRKKELVPNINADVPEEFRKFSTEITNKEYEYNMMGVTGVTMSDFTAPGEVPVSDAPLQGFGKTFTQLQLTKRITLEAVAYYYMFQAGDDKKIDAGIKEQILNFKNANTLAKNYLAQALIAGGWSSTVNFVAIGGDGHVTVFDTTGADGVPFFSASHPREDGGPVWSNIIVSGTNNPSASLTSIIAARTQHAKKKDGRGMPLIGSKLDRIMCQDMSATYALLSSLSKTLSSGKYPSAALAAGVFSTSAAAVDANPTDSFEVVGLTNYDGLGISSLMWFMVDSSKINNKYGLLYIQSKPFEVSNFQMNMFGNMDLVATGQEYLTMGGYDFRYWQASNGLNA